MKFAGMELISSFEHPGFNCVILYTSGCNFKCSKCNCAGFTEGSIQNSAVLKELKACIGKAQAVRISGGEATMQQDLYEFILRLRLLGFKVILDTNGSNPQVLERVIPLLDYISMSVKAPLNKYQQFIGCKVEANSILNSIDIISSSGLDHEFRTDIVPGLDKEDILEIGRMVSRGYRYVLQLPKGFSERSDRNNLLITLEELMRMINEREIVVRGLF